MANKKYKITFSKQVRNFIDKILDNEDKESFDQFADGIKKISENPEAGKRILLEFDRDVLDKINSYKGKKVNKFSKIDYGDDYSFIYDLYEGSNLEKNLEDFELDIGKSNVCMFGAAIYKENERIFSKELKEKSTKNITLDSVEYKEPFYIINLVNKEKLGDFFIKSYTLSI